MTERSPAASDQELIRAALEGDQGRFGELVERYQERLVNYLLRILRNPDDARDLSQEVFIKVYKALDRYNPEYKFSTWLFRVAQNAAIDQLRRRRLKVVSMDVDYSDDGSGGGWEFPSPDRGPYADLRNVERGRAIRKAVDALPFEYRELIVLRHFAELSYQEIADVKEMPLGTVKNKLFRSRQMLKETLADFLTD